MIEENDRARGGFQKPPCIKGYGTARAFLGGSAEREFMFSGTAS